MIRKDVVINAKSRQIKTDVHDEMENERHMQGSNHRDLADSTAWLTACFITSYLNYP